MLGFPAFLTCALAAARGYGRTAAGLFAATLAVLFLVTDLHSLLRVAVPHWAGTTDLGLAFERLATVHPFLPAPRAFAFLASLNALLVAALAWSCWRSWTRGEGGRSSLGDSSSV